MKIHENFFHFSKEVQESVLNQQKTLLRKRRSFPLLDFKTAKDLWSY